MQDSPLTDEGNRSLRASITEEDVNGGGDAVAKKLRYVVDAVWFVYTCRRLIYRTMITGTAQPAFALACAAGSVQ